MFFEIIRKSMQPAPGTASEVSPHSGVSLAHRVYAPPPPPPPSRNLPPLAGRRSSARYVGPATSDVQDRWCGTGRAWPVLPLLLATALATAGPVQAQTEIWTATLTTGHDSSSDFSGFATDLGSDDEDVGFLSNIGFTHEMVNYTVTQLFVATNNNLIFATTPDLPSGGAGLVLQIEKTSGELDLHLAHSRLADVYSIVDGLEWVFFNVLTADADTLLHGEIDSPDGMSILDPTAVDTIIDVGLSTGLNAPARGNAVIEGGAQVGKTLTANTNSIEDTDGLAGVIYSYRWIRVNDDGSEADISGANGINYMLVSADVGKKLKVKVDFTDDDSNAETKTSAPTAKVVAVARSCTPGNAWCATLTAGEQGYCLNVRGRCNPKYGTLSDDDFTLGTTDYTVKSLRWGVGSGSNLHLTLDQDFPATSLASLTLKVDTHEWALSDATRGNDSGENPAENGVANNYRWANASQAENFGRGVEVTVELLDATASDVTLSALGLVDESSNPVTLSSAFVSGTTSYAALVANGVETVTITATKTATGATVTILPADDGSETGHQVTLDVGLNAITATVVNSSRTGTYTVTVRRAAASNTLATGKPGIGGIPRNPQHGLTLTAETSGISDSDGLTTPGYTYQWIRVDGSDEGDISGATGITYRLTAADVGKTLKVRVGFTDDASNAEMLTSDATAAVVAQSVISFDNAMLTATEGAGSIIMALSLTPPAEGSGSVDLLTTYQGTATRADIAGVQVPLAFRPGHSAPSRTVSALDDEEDDDGESVEITLGVLPPWMTLGSPAKVTITLVDNDAEPTVSFTASATEVGEDVGTVTLTATISGTEYAEDQELTLEFMGTATAPDDYTVSGTMLTLARETAGASATVTVTVVNDMVDEDDEETIIATLRRDTTVVSTVTVTITDDDSATACSTTDPTQAWCATLTTGRNSGVHKYIGFATDLGSSDEDFGSLSATTFTHEAVDYTVTQLFVATLDATLIFATTPELHSDGAGLVLHIEKTSGELDLPLIHADLGENMSAVDGLEWEFGDAFVAGVDELLHDGTEVGTMIEVRLSTGFSTPARGSVVIDGAAQVGNTLTADLSGISDANGLTTPGYSGQWIRVNDDGSETDISGATGSTYMVTAADVGKRLEVKVDFTDDEDNSETKTSAQTAKVAVAARACTPGNVWCATLTVGSRGGGPKGYCLDAPVRCDNPYGALSDDGFTLSSVDYLVKSLRWGAGGADNGTGLHLTLDRDFPGAGLASLTLKVDVHEFVLSDAARGNGNGTSPLDNGVANNYLWDNIPQAIRDFGPGVEVTVDLLGSIPTDDATLSALSLIDESSNPITLSPPAFAPGTTSYAALVANSVETVTVTATKSATSAAVTIVPADADNSTAGDQVDLSVGANAITVTVVDGSTTGTYTVTVTRAVPTGTNTPARGSVVIDGAAQVGNTLTADPSGISDINGLATPGYTYQWIRVNDDGSEADISGADGINYMLVSADVGKKLKVKVDFTDDDSNTETKTNVQTVKVAAAARACTPGNAWCATLTVEDRGTGPAGYCLDARCFSQYGALSDTDFTLGSVDYLVKSIRWGTDVSGGNMNLHLSLDRDFPGASLASLTLKVDVHEFVLSDAARGNNDGQVPPSGVANNYRWSNIPQAIRDFGSGVDVTVELLGSVPTDDATLSALSLVDESSNPITLSPPTFAPGTTSYAALVANSVETVTVTATKSVTSAAVTIAPADADTSTAGDQVDLSVGANAITVTVVDGSTTGAYTVTVTRVAPTGTNTPAIGLVVIEGGVQVGQTLTADTRGISDINGLATPGYSYQWIRVNDDDSETDISTGSTYTVTAADVGKRLKVEVEFMDDANNGEESASGATARVVAAARACTPGNLWCATLNTVAGLGGYCRDVPGRCIPLFQDSFGSLSDDSFTLNGTPYLIKSLRWGTASAPGGAEGTNLHLTLDRDFPGASLASLTLKVGTHEFALSDAVRGNSDGEVPPGGVAHNYRWADAPQAIRDFGEEFDLDITVELLGSVPTDSNPEVRVKFTPESYTVAEGEDVAVTVLLNVDPEREVVIPVTAMNQGGASASDYSGAPTTLTFSSGETSKSFTVSATDDVVDDDGESVLLGFGSLPAGVTEALRATATVTITDNDGPAVTVTFMASSYTVTEGNSTTVTVELSADPEREVVVPVTAMNQGGASASDYSGAPTTLTFSSGETSKGFTVTATDDAVDDDGESVRLGFGSLPAGVTEALRATATVTITDDDERVVRVSPTALTVPEEGERRTYEVVLGSEPTGTVTVEVEVSVHAGTEVTVEPTAVMFTAADWEVAKTLTVSVDDDMEVEADVTVTLTNTVSGADYGANGVAAAVGVGGWCRGTSWGRAATRCCCWWPAAE